MRGLFLIALVALSACRVTLWSSTGGGVLNERPAAADSTVAADTIALAPADSARLERIARADSIAREREIERRSNIMFLIVFYGGIFLLETFEGDD